MTTAATIRRLRPSDYGTVIAVIDEWWGGRPMSDMLPRLFFEHFADTSFAADRAGTLAGFLVGFLSQSQPGEAYIHFVGVRPGQRGQGLGRRLYEAFFEAASARGCTVVRAVTAPVNTGNLLNDMSTNWVVQGAGRLGSIAPPVTGTTATAAYRARGDGSGRQRIAELADRFDRCVRHLSGGGSVLRIHIDRLTAPGRSPDQAL